MERNAEDFAAKYEKVYQDMFRFALYTLKNRHEAEDVVSETVLDAWKGIEGLKDENAFRAWIFQDSCQQMQTEAEILSEPCRGASGRSGMAGT